MTEEHMPSTASEHINNSGDSSELIGSFLAEKYDFHETETLKALREEAIQAFKSEEKQKYLDLIRMYNDLGQRLVEEKQGAGYPFGQLGLMLATASVRRDTGRWPEYIEDLEDALLFCQGQGYEDAVINVELIITHAQEVVKNLEEAGEVKP